MLWLLIAFALGAAGAALVVRRYFPRYITETLVETVRDSLPTPRRFRVIMATDNGGDARRLYEKIQTRNDGQVIFLDGEAQRSMKGAPHNMAILD